MFATPPQEPTDASSTIAWGRKWASVRSDRGDPLDAPVLLCLPRPRSASGRTCAGIDVGPCSELTMGWPLLQIDAGAELCRIYAGAEAESAGERGSRGGGRSNLEEGGREEAGRAARRSGGATHCEEGG
jgi:hypothetical protein